MKLSFLTLLVLGLSVPLFAQEKPRDLAAELDQIKQRLEKLEAAGPDVVAENKANEKTVAKMNAIMIPQLSFREASVFDVVNFLVATSRERDPDRNLGEEAGVNIVVNANKPVPRISISLRRVSLDDALTFVADITQLEKTMLNGVVVLKSKDAAEVRIGKRLDELAKTLDLKGDKAAAFEKAAADIRKMAAELPAFTPPPDARDGFFAVPKDAEDFFGDDPFAAPKPKPAK